MTMKKLPLAIAFGAFAIACSDPTMPAPALVGSTATLAVSSVNAYPFPIADGAVQLCKTSNVGGDFDFDATGPAGIDTDPDITIPAGGGTVCTIIYTSTLSRTDAGLSEGITITETTNANLTNIDIVRYLAPTVAYTASEMNDSHMGSTATIRINDDMARRVTFTNDTPVVTPGCTYTKGWYRNNGSSTITLTLDGRTVAEQQAIFNATPGKPGSVDFGDNNNLLNLYQQLLAALNNLDGNLTAGPDAVDAAVSDALAGTGGTGLNITTTLTNTQISDLIDVLSDFNEGTLTGWPHCDD